MCSVPTFIASLIVSSLIKGATLTNRITYCDFGKDHTMCKYKKEEPGVDCPPDVKVNRFSERDVKLMLEEHNKWRSKVANGKCLQQTCPKASNMYKLEWDQELETIALRHTLQCKVKLDANRRVLRFKFGQNIFQTDKIDSDTYLQTAVETWYNESKYLPSTFLTDTTFKKEWKMFISFTQLAWGNVMFVGCSMTNTGHILFIACNYGPTGNVDDNIVYKIGAPCAECPKGATCANKLCEIYNYEQQTVVTMGRRTINPKSSAHTSVTNLVLIAIILSLTCDFNFFYDK